MRPAAATFLQALAVALLLGGSLVASLWGTERITPPQAAQAVALALLGAGAAVMVWIDLRRRRRSRR